MDYVQKRFEFLQVERRPDGVVVLTMDNVRERNALNLVMIGELGEVLPQIAVDPAARALVITGAGSTFCAGGNIHALTPDKADSPEGPLTRPIWNTPNIPVDERLRATQTTGLRIMRLLYEIEKPTIAAIAGAAAGAGMDLALICDLRLMADTAFMTSSYVRVGLIPFDGGMWLLPRIVGLSRAYEIMYTGRRIAAEECERIGLATRVVPASSLMSEVVDVAGALARGPSIAHQVIKRLTQECLATDFAHSLEISYQARDAVFSTADHREGVRAFFEHRAPVFEGR